MGTIREWSDDDLNSKGTIPDRFSCKTNSRWSFFHPLKSLINPRYHIQTHSAWANFQSRETRAHENFIKYLCSLYIQLFSKARIRSFIHVNQKERSCTAKNVSLETKRLYLNVICFIRMVAFQLQLNADPFNHFGKFLLLVLASELNFCRQLLPVTLQNQLCAINQAANILAKRAEIVKLRKRVSSSNWQIGWKII